MVHQGDLSKEVVIASESIRQFCSIVCEMILLRSILRSDNDRTYFDSRLKHYCQESLAILHILQGLNIFLDNVRGPRSLHNFSLKGLGHQRLQYSANRKPGLPKYEKQMKKNSEEAGDTGEGPTLGLTLQLNGLAMGNSRDTLEVVYEESDEECELSNDDLAKLINNNNNSESVPELETKSAFPSSVSVSVTSPSPPPQSTDCDDPWRGYEKYTSEAIILLNQLGSKRDCIKVSNNKTGVRADESIKIYPLAGAFLGSCLGGPVGFLAGVKVIIIYRKKIHKI